ncbi:hypothetical protein PPSIR1_15245 [Plesiocystis pacifica SIR-1]|uniref:DoxX family membrane protein n=1 Tax=Plesiocystis pacifica SIR-1 TaxID=391625 RepID=A6GKG2_9BACT|nr:MauE/DoxX family redox-associated membrane protein [Plesiocystis pacifica]EDM73638.1 hypothetical protein PPSIR1_15245 [Plesiocystis pacifica SIR-1]
MKPLELILAGLRVLLAIAMVFAGTMHFLNPDFFLAIMPDYLPLHAAAVYLSGVVEIGLGVALFVPATRTWAGWGLISLFLAVWPANIWMATEGIQPPGVGAVSPTAAWVRVAFQPVLMLWVWAVSRPAKAGEPQERAVG